MGTPVPHAHGKASPSIIECPQRPSPRYFQVAGGVKRRRVQPHPFLLWQNSPEKHQQDRQAHFVEDDQGFVSVKRSDLEAYKQHIRVLEQMIGRIFVESKGVIKASETRNSGNGQKQIPVFVKNLWLMISDPEHTGITWRGKKAFGVKDTKHFELNVLPRFFKHNKLSSFTRQLNMYNFKKVKDSAVYSWTHEFLERDNYNLLTKVQRKLSSGEKKTEALKAQLKLCQDAIRNLELRFKATGRILQPEIHGYPVDLTACPPELIDLTTRGPEVRTHAPKPVLPPLGLKKIASHAERPVQPTLQPPHSQAVTWALPHGQPAVASSVQPEAQYLQVPLQTEVPRGQAEADYGPELIDFLF